MEKEGNDVQLEYMKIKLDYVYKKDLIYNRVWKTSCYYYVIV